MMVVSTLDLYKSHDYLMVLVNATNVVTSYCSPLKHDKFTYAKCLQNTQAACKSAAFSQKFITCSF